jgi:cell fate (sporulation/competence/biofilm development) regulator YmcA (YheA/YmcA/DUF963 family)
MEKPLTEKRFLEFVKAFETRMTNLERVLKNIHEFEKHKADAIVFSKSQKRKATRDPAH